MDEKERSFSRVLGTGIGGIALFSTIGHWLYPGVGAPIGAFIGFVLAALVSIRG